MDRTSMSDQEIDAFIAHVKILIDVIEEQMQRDGYLDCAVIREHARDLTRMLNYIPRGFNVSGACSPPPDCNSFCWRR